MDYDLVVSYGAMIVQIISRKTLSSDLCIIIGLVMHYYSYTQIRDMVF